MNAPKISIIIPVYKAEKYIAKTIELILKQNFSDFELILVDDGSPDNSGAICDEYAKKDSRIKVFHQENQGAGTARNVGLDNAQGEFIWFVDADDEITEDSIKKLVTTFEENPNNDILVFDALSIVNNQRMGNILTILNTDKNTVLKSEDNKIDDLFLRIGSIPWNKCLRRSLIEKYLIDFQNIKACNDVYFSFISLAVAKNILYLKDSLYCYNNLAEGAISRTRGTHYLCIIESAIAVREKLKSLNLYEKYKKDLYLFYYIHIYIQYTTAVDKKGLLKEAKKFLPFYYYNKLLLKIKYYLIRHKILS